MRKGPVFKILRVYFLLALVFLSACASYQSEVKQARNFLTSGEPEKAASILEAKSKDDGKDQVVYLLDYALALHLQGEYKKSNEAFLQAEDLAEVKDFTSITRETAVFLTSERLRQYKSERYENLLINGYLALNFLMLGEYDEALVECRKIDQKLTKLRLDGEKATNSFFARYLSALIWEAQGKWDSAYIDFKNAYDIDPSLSYLKTDLIRAAWRARRFEALKLWQKKWPSVNLSAIKKDAENKGDLVFIYQQGWVPRKHQRPRDFRFPYLLPVQSNFQNGRLVVDGKQRESTKVFYDVTSDSISTINAYYKVLVAKKIAGVAAKLVIADQINQKQKGLGSLVYLAMTVADQADLRQWSTLPASFQISRMSLNPGEHTVRLEAQGGSGEVILWEGKSEIKPGKVKFLTERSF